MDYFLIIIFYKNNQIIIIKVFAWSCQFEQGTNNKEGW
jgi:hypothetical protein